MIIETSVSQKGVWKQRVREREREREREKDNLCPSTLSNSIFLKVSHNTLSSIMIKVYTWESF